MSGFSWAEFDSLCRDPVTGIEKSYEECEEIKKMLREKEKKKNEQKYEIISIPPPPKKAEKAEKTEKKKKKNKKKTKKDQDDEILNRAIKENKKLMKQEESKKYIKNNAQLSNWIYSGALKGSTPELAEKLIRSTMKSDLCVQSLTSLKEFEKTLSREKNETFWKSVSTAVYSSYGPKKPEDVSFKVKFYESMLAEYIKDVFVSCISDLINKKIFEKFKSEEEPLLMLVAQKDMKDLFPVIDLILPANKLMTAGLIPKDFMTFNPYGAERKFLCCGLFYSFSLSYNLFFAFFTNKNNNYVFYSMIFDRSSDIPNFMGQTVNIQKEQ